MWLHQGEQRSLFVSMEVGLAWRAACQSATNLTPSPAQGLDVDMDMAISALSPTLLSHARVSHSI